MKSAYFKQMSMQAPMGQWPAPPELWDAKGAIRGRDETFEEVELADRLGFDWVSCAEHHFGPLSLTPSIGVYAAALTQRVKRAKIAILGALLPGGNPVRIAEEIAMLDLFSDGRVIAALLRGAPFEYVVYSVNPSESRGRFEEAWELITRAWTEPRPFGWDGEYYKYRQVAVWPRPIQQPTPPLIMSGSSKDSGEFAARKHVSLGLAFTTLPLAAEAARFYREKCAEYGWTPTPEQVLYRATAHVAEDDKTAKEDLEPMFAPRPAGRGGGIADANRLVAEAGFFGQRDANLTERFRTMGHDGPSNLEQQIELGHIVAGSPASVVAQLKRLNEEIGCGVIELSFHAPGGDREKRLKAMDLFASKVMPEVRDL